MTVRIGPFRPLVRRSVRYLLVSRGFLILEAVCVFASLSFVLTGSRIAAIDRLGNRADIVASIVVTTLTIVLLRAMNRRAMIAIDRRFFREAYNAQLVLTELSNAVRSFTSIEQLVEVVATKISDALHPANVTVFLEEEMTGNLVSAVFLGSAAVKRRGRRSRTLVLPRDGWTLAQLGKSPRSTAIDIQKAGALIDNSKIAGADKPYQGEYSVVRRIRSLLVVPVESNGHLYGVISLGRRLGDLGYSDDDKQMLLTVAAQMATLIENLKLVDRLAEEQSIKRELELAAAVQQRMFPKGVLENTRLEVCGSCIPARGVGGDYYDYFVVRPDQIGIAIADVAGKGIAAALLTSTLQAMLRSQLISGVSRLTDLVFAMSRLLWQSTSDSAYASFFFCEFDNETRDLTYVNAGHNPPMIVRRLPVAVGGDASLRRRMYNLPGDSAGNGEHGIVVGTSREEVLITLLTEGGPIIGTFLDGAYKQATVHMESGDLLVAYTDGVTEALNPAGEEFGEERLISIVAESLKLTACELTQTIIANLKEWQRDAPQHDDVTFVVAKVK